MFPFTNPYYSNAYLIDIIAPAKQGQNTCNESSTPDQDYHPLDGGHGGPVVGVPADVLDNPGPLQGEAGEGPDGCHGGYDRNDTIHLKKKIYLLTAAASYLSSPNP